MLQISQSYRSGELSLVDLPAPRTRAGCILVNTSVSLISSGTEKMIVDLAKKSILAKARERPDLVAKVVQKASREGALAALEAVLAKLESPIPLGYSLSGRVADVGSGVRDFVKGERIACAGAGYANHAEINSVPQNLAVRVPDEVSDEEAAFVTVGAIALHGVRLVRPSLGEVVAVIGLGLLGQIAVSLLVAHGCDVVAVDVDRAKVDRALGRGAVAGGVSGVDDLAEIVRAASRGNGADAVVITASSPTNDPLVVAGEVARDRATISVVGLLPLEIPRKAYYEKELNVVVSRSYGPGRYDPQYEEQGQEYPIGYVRWSQRRNLEAVLRAIATKRLDVASLITHRFAFSDALSAYELITNPKAEPHLGVLLEYPQALGFREERPPTVSTRRRTGTDPLGIAVVGTGSFASAVLMPALSKIASARLIATASGRGLSAKHAADRFDAVRVAGSFDEILTMQDVDAVLIATRHDLHAEQASRAMRAGKSVFLEKPAAVTEDQLAELASVAASTGGTVMVGFNRRFSPYARKVKEVFAQRKSGLVMSARINAGRVAAGSWVVDPDQGGGRIIGEGCHFIDLLSYWAGAPPTRVCACAIGGSGGYQGGDNLVVSISFADGSVGQLLYTSMGDAKVGKEHYEVFCEGAVAVIDDFRTLALTKRGKTKTTRALRADKGHSEELRVFVEACRDGSGSPIPWSSLEATTRATFAVEKSRFEGTSVDV